MSTLPSYPAITAPLQTTDQMYIERGSASDRGKRVSWLQIEQQIGTDLGAIINSQPTDSDGVATGDFLAGENGGIGKKIPVGAFELVGVREILPYTGTKAFRFDGSTSGYGVFVDSLNIAGNNRPNVFMSEGLGRFEIYVNFMFNPTLITSSSRTVVLTLSDASDPIALLIALLLDAKSPDIGVTGPCALQIASGTFIWPCTVASDGTGISITFKKANGADLLYSDLYHASITLSHITVQMRVFT